MRLDRLHHKSGVDRLHRQSAEYWRRIILQRVAPLLPMLGVIPARFMRRDIGCRTFIERHHPSGVNARPRPLGVAVLDRIDAGMAKLATSQRRVSSFL